MSRTTKTMVQQLRSNLAAFREQRGLTQVELGARAGLASASVSHFETGQRTPTLETLVKLADALGASLDALVGRESSKLGMKVDPIFVRASNSDSKTLEAVKRVTAALLEQGKPSQQR